MRIDDYCTPEGNNVERVDAGAIPVGEVFYTDQGVAAIRLTDDIDQSHQVRFALLHSGHVMYCSKTQKRRRCLDARMVIKEAEPEWLEVSVMQPGDRFIDATGSTFMMLNQSGTRPITGDKGYMVIKLPCLTPCVIACTDYVKRTLER